MKRLLLFILLLIFAGSITFAQKVVSGKSKSAYVNITKDPPKPPYLEIVPGSLRFNDNNGNNKIDANENTTISFQLKNSGMGTGLNLRIITSENSNIKGLSYPKTKNIGTLGVKQTMNCEIHLQSGMELPSSKASFTIKVEEANGFDSDPFYIEIDTRKFIAPSLKVVDYKLSSSNGTLQKRRPFNLQVLVQNVGEGTARNVRANITVPDNSYCLSSNENHKIGTLEAGEQYLIDYSFVTTADYYLPQITFTVILTESFDRFGSTKMLSMKMNQDISDTKLIVEGKTETGKNIVIGSLTSAVDKNIPTNAKKAKRIALIIGNEDYSRTLNAEINVAFARNDAEVFRQYALNTLGVEERNMHFFINATAGQMRREIDLVTALLKKLGPDAELIFYYAGHGFPDENTKIPYLIPVDVDATNLSSAVKLSDVYKKFGNTGAARVTVFLDACFSGGGRNQGLLAARGVAIKPKKEAISGNMVVFSATTGEQSAMAFDAEKHGMFTYFLLKKIQQSKGVVSYGELSDYLINNVGIESLRENGKPQDPEVNTSYKIKNSWSQWKLK